MEVRGAHSRTGDPDQYVVRPRRLRRVALDELERPVILGEKRGSQR
jgi:hypothetical protein